jgi:RNA polymerase sigma-70 factor (ECF subfamily)
MDRTAEEAFDQFFRSVRPRLVGQAYLLTGDQATAQDLAQEALEASWSEWSTVGVLDDPEAWTRRVLHNRAVSEVRRRGWWQQRFGRESEVAGPDVTGVLVARALSELPIKRRRALVLHDVAGVPVDEVANELGVPSGTVRSWLVRDRARLARKLRSEFPSSQKSKEE